MGFRPARYEGDLCVWVDAPILSLAPMTIVAASRWRLIWRLVPHVMLASTVVTLTPSVRGQSANGECAVERVPTDATLDTALPTSDLLASLLFWKRPQAYEDYVLARVRAAADTSLLSQLWALEANTRCERAMGTYTQVAYALEVSGAPTLSLASVALDPGMPDCAVGKLVDALAARGEVDGGEAIADTLSRSVASREGRCMVWSSVNKYKNALEWETEYEARSIHEVATDLMAGILEDAYHDALLLARHGKPFGELDLAATAAQDHFGTAWKRRRLPALARSAPSVVLEVASSILDRFDASVATPLTQQQIDEALIHAPGGDFTYVPSAAEIGSARRGAELALDFWGFRASVPASPLPGLWEARLEAATPVPAGRLEY